MIKTAVIIPIRGIEKSMSRLRESLPDKQVNKIVKKLLIKTIKSTAGLNFEKYILTSEETLVNEIPDLPDFDIYLDSGEDLNLALSQFVDSTNFDRYMLIMPDLPGISPKVLETITHLTKLHTYVISNTEDLGTACCILPGEFFTKNLFGEKSAEKLLNLAKDRKISVSQIEIAGLKKDLDTYKDYEFWKEELN